MRRKKKERLTRIQRNKTYFRRDERLNNGKRRGQERG